MSRAVYVGGFGNGRSSADRVADAIAAEFGYEDVDRFTFAYAMDHSRDIRRAVQDVPVVTHSAGLMAVAGKRPSEVLAFNAPMPASKLRLIGRSVTKTLRMHRPGIGIQSSGDILSVARYDTSATAELTRHAYGNLKRLGQIAFFNSVNAAIGATEYGINTTLVTTDGDEYFRIPTWREESASAHGVRIARLSGVHDELVLRPQQTLSQLNETVSDSL